MNIGLRLYCRIAKSIRDAFVSITRGLSHTVTYFSVNLLTSCAVYELRIMHPGEEQRPFLRQLEDISEDIFVGRKRTPGNQCPYITCLSECFGDPAR
jgi:hypothetical protein